MHKPCTVGMQTKEWHSFLKMLRERVRVAFEWAIEEGLGLAGQGHYFRLSNE